MKPSVASLLLAGVILTGCADGAGVLPQYIEARIKSFSVIDKINPGTTIAIYGGEIDSTLEFDSVRNRVRQYLERSGYVVVNLNEKPDQVMLVLFGIDNGQTVQRNVSVPIFGQTGVASSSTYGTINSYGTTSTLNATTFNTPSFGVTGYNNFTVNDKVYSRYLILDIIDPKQSSEGRYKFVYQSELNSTGSCGNFHSVLDSFLQMSLGTFPGPSSRSETASVPWNGKC